MVVARANAPQASSFSMIFTSVSPDKKGGARRLVADASIDLVEQWLPLREASQVFKELVHHGAHRRLGCDVRRHQDALVAPEGAVGWQRLGGKHVERRTGEVSLIDEGQE